MYKITEEQIDFIIDDIASRGIVLEQLQENLLDHICCIIEKELEEDGDFHTFYTSMLPRFFNQELAEIQTETDNLLRFKNFYIMKKALKISGFGTVVLTILAAIFKTLHFPGTAALIVLSGFLFTLVFLPILIIVKFRDEESKVDKWVFSFGFFLAICLSIGLIFKVMHWPGANILMLSATVLFTFLYVPIYFLSRIKRPELRFNTIVNSVLMMACGGIFYSLFNLSYSYEFEQQMTKNHVYLHENSQKIFASNKQLYALTDKQGAVKEIHEQSLVVNEKIEEVAATIMRHRSCKPANVAANELIESMVNYNANIEQLNLDSLQPLETHDITVLTQLGMEVGMTTIARLQQQLAVNENSYLIAETMALRD